MIGSAPNMLAQQRLVDPGVGEGIAAEMMPDRMWWNPMATIVKVDLSDPTSPERTEELTFEGWVVASRAVGDSIRMVVSSSSWQLPFVTPDQIMANWPVWQQNDANAWTRAESIALSQNRAVVSSSVIEDWFPRYTLESTGGLNQVQDGTLADCDSIAHPEEFAGLGITSILTFDANQGLKPIDTFGLVTDSQTVYASTDAIYVATQQWRDWNVVPERRTGSNGRDGHDHDPSLRRHRSGLRSNSPARVRWPDGCIRSGQCPSTTECSGLPRPPSRHFGDSGRPAARVS